MLSNSVPDLTFPTVDFGSKEQPWDFAIFLYKGGSLLRVNQFHLNLKEQKLGNPLLERLTLIKKIHDEVNGDLVSGKSKETIKTLYYKLKDFFSWLDDNVENVKLENIENLYFEWCNHLSYRQRILKDISQLTFYNSALTVATILDRVLDKNYSIFRKTGISQLSKYGKLKTSTSSKLLLEDTVNFGQVLVDISKQLTTEKINGDLPVSLNINDKELTIWLDIREPGKRSRKRSRSPNELKQMEETRKNMGDEKSYLRRVPLINMRIEAELLIFIAQTGMNLEQARQLKLDDFVYVSHLDGYQVKAYKARRSGSVLFEIFKEYRQHFEQYLKWRKEWFENKNSNELFPFIFSEEKVLAAPTFHRLKKFTKKYNLPFVNPSLLRKARVNWMLRTELSPQQVAESAQHDIKTLFRAYAMPNPQLAMVEIAQFHKMNEQIIPAVAPGACSSQIPISIKEVKDSSPEPDCITSSGCLFCKNHRDIDSEEHVWSLASYRHLKSIELASFKKINLSSEKNPIEIIIDRITEKLEYFKNSSEEREKWVLEALNKIDEGDYHMMWDGLIQLQELNGGE